MRDVWNFPLVQGKERLRDKSGKAAHPTQKPEAMLERIITGRYSFRPIYGKLIQLRLLQKN